MLAEKGMKLDNNGDLVGENEHIKKKRPKKKPKKILLLEAGEQKLEVENQELEARSWRLDAETQKLGAEKQKLQALLGALLEKLKT